MLQSRASLEGHVYVSVPSRFGNPARDCNTVRSCPGHSTCPGLKTALTAHRHFPPPMTPMTLRPFLPALLALLTACDSTPRERQEIARHELKNLDTLAANGAKTVARAARTAARYDAANRARRATPLDPRQQLRVEGELLGPYADQLAALTPATLGGAYQYLLQQTRARHSAWTARDWDYARAAYARLNAELKRVRLDLPARDELRIRAWQVEFVGLQAQRTAHALQTAGPAEKASR